MLTGILKPKTGTTIPAMMEFISQKSRSRQLYFNRIEKISLTNLAENFSFKSISAR